MSEKSAEKPVAAGKSSYDLVEPDRLFGYLELKPGTVFLDLACGRGAYSLDAARRVGAKGLVYAVDLWEDGIRFLEERLAELGVTNIKPMHSDGAGIPLVGSSIDLCLMATVLHDFVEDATADAILEETARLLKPNGILAVVEFKKIEGPPGPPIHIRMSPADVERKLTPFGFKRLGREEGLEVGPYNYLMTFSMK